MNKQSMVYGVVGLLLGVIIATFTANYAVNTSNQTMMRMMGINTAMVHSPTSSMTMDDMSESLAGKTGDDFDNAFIDAMIEHHQGAIDMAERAKTSAKHDEIKLMATDIITAQSLEIGTMNQWRADWGYTRVNSSQDHHSVNN